MRIACLVHAYWRVIWRRKRRLFVGEIVGREVEILADNEEMIAGKGFDALKVIVRKAQAGADIIGREEIAPDGPVSVADRIAGTHIDEIERAVKLFFCNCSRQTFHGNRIRLAKYQF